MKLNVGGQMFLGILTHPIGFFGQTGMIWAFIGLICLAVVVALLFKIFRLALPALGVTEPWVSILYWLAVLILFLIFINYAFGWNW
jgi:hypothetical protein